MNVHCHVDKNTYCPTQPVHSLSGMDDYYNLSTYTCPPSPQDNRDLEQVAANRSEQDLAVNSDVFIPTPRIPSKVHVLIMVMFVNLVQNHNTVIVSSCQCKTLIPGLIQPKGPYSKHDLEALKNN